MKQFLFLVFFSLLLGSKNFLLAQKKNENGLPKPPKIKTYRKPLTRKAATASEYKQEFNFGVTMATDGWGMGGQYFQRIENESNKDWFGLYLHISQLHDSRESKIFSTLKINNQDASAGNPRYAFGKINALFPIKIGGLYRKQLSGRLENQHIRIYAIGGGGVNISFLKPYYIQLATGGTNAKLVNVKYADSIKTFFLDPRYIAGSSGFTKGLDEREFLFGGHLNAAFQFEYIPILKKSILLELGVNLDAYTEAVPLMANEFNKQVFTQAYISVKKGWRKRVKS
jgi:hypothetical protein